jgi:uncharacterized membrane protein
MIAGAVAALAPGWLQAPPWVLALLLSGILVIVWVVVIGHFLRAHAEAEAEAESSGDGRRPATS